jgi:two-component system NtrC family sensor kinase
MTFLQFLHLYSCLVDWFLALFIVKKNPHSRLNQCSAFILLAFGLWSYSIYYAHSPRFPLKLAMAMKNVAVLGWGSIGSFFLLLVVYFTSTKEKEVSKTKLFLILLPTVITAMGQWTYGLFDDSVFSPQYGWISQWKRSFFLYFYFTYYPIYILLGLILLYRFTRKTQNTLKKKQAKVLIVITFLTLLVISINSVILPMMGSNLPKWGNVAGLVWCIGFIYIITRHQFLTLTPEMAANNIISTMSDFFILVDPQNKIIRTNQATLNCLGYTEQELIGQPLSLLLCSKGVHQETTKKIEHRIPLHNKDACLRTKEKDQIPVLLSYSVLENDISEEIGSICIARDITQSRIMQIKQEQAYEQLKIANDQLIHSDKMVAIGQLAAGVAHEINNPAGFVIANLEVSHNYYKQILNCYVGMKNVLYRYAEHQADLKKILDQHYKKIDKDYEIDFIMDDGFQLLKDIQEGALRVKEIVANLSNYANTNKDIVEDVDINLLMDKSINLAWNELKYKCEIVKSYGQIPMIPINPCQITQVFINLLVNAAQAIETKGKIFISTDAKDYFLNITIRDTGKGIPEEELDKILDPFFTTKAAGIGTGLGLSIVNSIIKIYNGKIDVESQVGAGTTFRIRLPLKNTYDENNNSLETA